MTEAPEPLFRTKAGLILPGFPAQSILNMRAALKKRYGLHSMQLCEAASYSMAMVVRHALGLTAEGGRICAIVADCFCGWIALATLRHLAIAGAKSHIFTVTPGAHSEEFNRQLKPLQEMQIPFSTSMTTGKQINTDTIDLLSASHNIICGVFDLGNPLNYSYSALNRALNDMRTPIHTIEAPLGVNPETGIKQGEPMYASSTLSVGAPLTGLVAGSDFVGRHYLCDISITRDVYLSEGFDLSPLFAEQPVSQIFPGAEKAQE